MHLNVYNFKLKFKIHFFLIKINWKVQQKIFKKIIFFYLKHSKKKLKIFDTFDHKTKFIIIRERKKQHL